MLLHIFGLSYSDGQFFFFLRLEHKIYARIHLSISARDEVQYLMLLKFTLASTVSASIPVNLKARAFQQEFP